MEFLQGEPLSERLKREGRLAPSRALSIAAQVADALYASHEHGIIHRDLKPENIFLIARGGSRDFVKVLDFGLAKLTQSGEKVSHKTRAGALMGTPYYMAPEQCEGKAEIDHRSDIYSLGVLLFEMLTGKVPFGGDGYGEIIVKHITMPPPSVRSVIPELPHILDPILFRALAKDRAQRFQTMADLREALWDPDGYATAAPSIGIPEDLSGVARAAAPMARSEMNIGSKAGNRTGRGDDAPSGSLPSTFRQGIGEIIDDLTPKKRTSRALVFIALASLSGAAFVGVTTRREQRRAAPIAALPARPASVRVNFNSDPDGATIVTAEGKAIGRTPLSVEIPYSDSAVEFLFRKAGYETKTMYIVPNLPSPLFATMQAVPRPDPPGSAAAATSPWPHQIGGKRGTGKGGRKVGASSRRARPVETTFEPDGDGVMAPSIR
jgi:serine/threonine-protein kinase